MLEWITKRRYGRWSTRRWALLAGLGTAALAGGAYFYYWLYNDVEEDEDDESDEPFSFLRDLSTSHDATSRALTSPEKSEKNLQAHFENIQRISDSTTLPQMLGELEKGLERAASVDVILSELRRSSTGNLQTKASKVELWNELKLVSWSRAMSAVWLTVLLDLLLRVQLNILGRHLFAQQTLMNSPRFRPDGSSGGVKVVSEGSQEMFLEYAHYLPERAVTAVVAKLRQLVAEELKDVGLKDVLSFEQVVEHTGQINDAFEEWAIDESWAQLVLPSDQEANEYFSNFRPSSSGGLEPSSSSADSSVVQGMIEELHMVMKSVRFSATVLDSMKETLKQFQMQLESEMNSQNLPLAKLIPKVVSASQSLIDGSTSSSQQWIQAIADLPRVKELCGSVYSCGPPPAFLRNS